MALMHPIRSPRPFLVAGLLGLGVTTFAAAPPAWEIWSVDPLVKVFPDESYQRTEQMPAEVARGEHASFQVVLRSKADVVGLQAEVAPFRRAWSLDVLKVTPPRWVGYVPVDRPTQKPSKDQLRPPPASYPDPLLESARIDVPARSAQAVWITLPIPTNAKAGLYRSTLKLKGLSDGRVKRARYPLEVRVHPVTVGRSRLWVTDWYAMHWPHMEIAPEAESADYYALLRRYARNLADHRHNVALISPLGLARFTVGPDGQLAMDFSRFDRWVEIFRDAGVIGRIEGGHIGGRRAGWESEFAVTIHEVANGRVVSRQVDPGSVEAERFYARFFPQLVRHLKTKGWLNDYLQHLADEPIASNIDTYRAMAQLARKYGPELRIVEACHTKDLVGAIDVWVPQLNYLHQDLAHYQERQSAGDEVWFYTCVFPQGEYANRFIEQPLIKTRLLHWINFRYGITGYLHWGYNHWTGDSPFTHTTRPHGGPPYLPAGDPWIVYPGKDGPLDSIRFEAMRDGIADHELLSQLAERDPGTASRLASTHVLEFDRYDTDIARFRATRRELLQTLNPKD